MAEDGEEGLLDALCMVAERTERGGPMVEEWLSSYLHKLVDDVCLAEHERCNTEARHQQTHPYHHSIRQHSLSVSARFPSALLLSLAVFTYLYVYVHVWWVLGCVGSPWCVGGERVGSLGGQVWLVCGLSSTGGSLLSSDP